MTHYAIIGRIIGDDEDTTRMYSDCTRDEAIEAYKADMYEAEGFDEHDMLYAEDAGEGCVITAVLQSESPIQQI